MPRRKLGRTGIEVGILGLGTVKIGRNTGLRYATPFELPTDAEVDRLLASCAELGVNLLDTAPAYGVSEERIGDSMRRNSWFGGRSNWVISTKVGEEFDPVSGTSSFDFTARGVRASVQRSLRRLGTDRLDLVLMHSSGDDQRMLRDSGALEELGRLRSEGLVRSFGASTKTLEGGLMATALRGVSSGRKRSGPSCAAVMVTLNWKHRAEAAVVRAADRAGMGVLIKKALSSGRLLEGGSSRSAGTLQGALNFVFGDDKNSSAVGSAVTSVVVGTLSPEHLREAAECARRAIRTAPA